MGVCCAGVSCGVGEATTGCCGTSLGGIGCNGPGDRAGGPSSTKLAFGDPHSMQNLSSGEGWFPQLGQSIRI